MIKQISFILLANFWFIHSQSAIIIDIETKYPLQDVNIFNHLHGTTSDASGRFNLDDIFSDNDVIMFSRIGYKSIHLAKKDISKAKRDLDYQPKISLEEGLTRFYNSLK